MPPRRCRPSRILLSTVLAVLTASAGAASLRIATFNVSMEGGNYVPAGREPRGDELPRALADGGHPQIRNIAEIIQRVRPDVLLLNEFDYHEPPERTVRPFLERYLGRAQNGAEPIRYPHYFSAPVNTGVDSGMDLDGDGNASGRGQDAFGYGLYPGQYGMLLLSRFPIDADAVRTFRHFLWRDMPGNLLEDMRGESGELFYPPEVQARLRLSSKSHWDVPLIVDGERLHVLASHPTPPVFDGPEDRNGRRNHDEIRFWVDYIGADDDAAYFVDDRGRRGGLQGGRFLVLGDLNASAVEGDARRGAIRALLEHPRVRRGRIPASDGGRGNRADSEFSPTHTASWGLRADYVIPGRGLQVRDAGVFWPPENDPLHRLVKDRRSSSDHRLVWIDVELVDH